MRGPYGFEQDQNCRSCTVREEGFLCQLSLPALADFQGIKSSATYPAGALLFLEKQDSRGVFVVCGGQVKLSISSLQNENVRFEQSRNVRFHRWPGALWKRSESP
jgi:CRP/FNR family cyclic AMP-dependent transcriptional regulator